MSASPIFSGRQRSQFIRLLGTRLSVLPTVALIASLGLTGCGNDVAAPPLADVSPPVSVAELAAAYATEASAVGIAAKAQFAQKTLAGHEGRVAVIAQATIDQHPRLNPPPLPPNLSHLQIPPPSVAEAELIKLEAFREADKQVTLDDNRRIAEFERTVANLVEGRTAQRQQALEVAPSSTLEMERALARDQLTSLLAQFE